MEAEPVDTDIHRSLSEHKETLGFFYIEDSQAQVAQEVVEIFKICLDTVQQRRLDQMRSGAPLQSHSHSSYDSVINFTNLIWGGGDGWTEKEKKKLLLKNIFMFHFNL